MKGLSSLWLVSFPLIVHAFSPGARHTITSTIFGTRLGSSVDDQEAIHCFIVNAFEVDEEGTEPEIVCTSDPNSYAWFNGISKDDMKRADCERDDFLECVEGASPRGEPEWECKMKSVVEEPWQ